MIYRAKGHTIHSENAAKSPLQVSKYLVDWIKAREKVNSALDYGCGKLRYGVHLLKKAERLTLLDSQLQLERQQKIGDDYTTIYDFSKKHKNCRVVAYEDFENDKQKYDFILCANVLSAIPSVKIRSRVLSLIASHLKKREGSCLFVTQYRNSYFKKAMISKSTIKHLDGWIAGKANSASYFGILSADKVVQIIKRNDLEPIKVWRKGESAYVLAKSKL